MRKSPLISAAVLAVVVGAPDASAQGAFTTATSENNANFGGLYARIDTDTPIGSARQLGCAMIGPNIYVTGGPINATNIYRFDRNGMLLGQVPEDPIHLGSAWGIRDMAVVEGDVGGTFIPILAGGSEAGLTFQDPMTGALVTSIRGANGTPQAVTNPVGGVISTVAGTIRALAWDPAANGGNGYFYTANFGSDIWEFDSQGMINQTFLNNGWVAYGLAFDRMTGNLWVNSAPNSSFIAEIDTTGFTLTGRVLDQPVPGAAQGGLSEMDGGAGNAADWPVFDGLVALSQATPDTVGLIRTHLFAQKAGWDEIGIITGVNGAPSDGSEKLYAGGDTLTIGSSDPTGILTGTPLWTIWNFGNAATGGNAGNMDVPTLLPQFGVPVMPEARAQSLFSTPPNPGAQIVGLGVGQTINVPLGNFPVAFGDTIRIQGVHIEPLAVSTLQLDLTNEVHFLAAGFNSGIVFQAKGANSFNADITNGFWSVEHISNHPPIASITIDVTGMGGTIDTDQTGMADVFEGGNSTVTGCLGTYRNNSAVNTGLVFAGTSVPTCDPTANSGWVGGAPGPTNFNDVTFTFTGPTFAAQKFEFDADTDGGNGVSGGAMAGTTITINLVGGGVLNGALMADPLDPNRSFVHFP